MGETGSKTRTGYPPAGPLDDDLVAANFLAFAGSILGVGVLREQVAG